MVTKNRNKNYKKYIDERLYGLCCCYAPPTPTKPPPSKRNKKLNFLLTDATQIFKMVIGFVSPLIIIKKNHSKQNSSKMFVKAIHRFSSCTCTQTHRQTAKHFFKEVHPQFLFVCFVFVFFAK